MQPKTICQLNICCCRSMKQYSWQTNLRRTKTAVHGHNNHHPQEPEKKLSATRLKVATHAACGVEQRTRYASNCSYIAQGDITKQRPSVSEQCPSKPRFGPGPGSRTRLGTHTSDSQAQARSEMATPPNPTS